MAATVSGAPAAGLPDLPALGAVAEDFRRRYRVATDAEAERTDRDWDAVWAHAARAAAAEALRPGADHGALRARLAALLRAWRGALLDPVRLYARSLFVQEVVHAGMAAVEAWCDENRPAPPPALGPPAEADPPTADRAYSPEWRLMLAHPAAFDGYRIGGGEDRSFRFRPCVNLYGIRAFAHDAARCDPLDYNERRALLLAAVGETLRYDDPGERRYLAAATGGRPFTAPDGPVGRDRPGAVDAETVARDCCGYPAFTAVRDLCDNSYAVWRRPIAATEAEAMRLTESLECAPRLLARWLRDHAGCGPWHAGVRFPPAFTALLAARGGTPRGEHGSPRGARHLRRAGRRGTRGNARPARTVGPRRRGAGRAERRRRGPAAVLQSLAGIRRPAGADRGRPHARVVDGRPRRPRRAGRRLRRGVPRGVAT